MVLFEAGYDVIPISSLGEAVDLAVSTSCELLAAWTQTEKLSGPHRPGIVMRDIIGHARAPGRPKTTRCVTPSGERFSLFAPTAQELNAETTEDVRGRACVTIVQELLALVPRDKLPPLPEHTPSVSARDIEIVTSGPLTRYLAMEPHSLLLETPITMQKVEDERFGRKRATPRRRADLERGDVSQLMAHLADTKVGPKWTCELVLAPESHEWTLGLGERALMFYFGRGCEGSAGSDVRLEQGDAFFARERCDFKIKARGASRSGPERAFVIFRPSG